MIMAKEGQQTFGKSLIKTWASPQTFWETRFEQSLNGRNQAELDCEV